MSAFFRKKGEVVLPYDRAMLEKIVAAEGGVMKPGCKFRVTMASRKPAMWYSLPSVFRCSFYESDDGIHIKYKASPAPMVWLIGALPILLVVALILLDMALESVTLLGILVGAVIFGYTYQRTGNLARFLERFAK